MTSLLYLHGFLSGPRSMKGRALETLCRERGIGFCAPDLNAPPDEAIRRIRNARAALADKGVGAVVGSSLGGFYATVLAAETCDRTAVVNPAVEPWKIVSCYLGWQPLATTGARIWVDASHAHMLKAMAVSALPNPERILTLLTTGDEVLDWTAAAERYADSPSIVIPGGDHAVSDFAEHAEHVMRFLFEQKFL